MKKSKLLIAGSAISLALCTAAPLMAQDQDATEEQATEDDEDEEEANAKKSAIVVTGSRISRPTLVSDVPVTSVTAGDLLDSGKISLGDALNDLPSLRSTFSTSNSQRFIGTTGLSFLDLRGLGTSRTLVLVNGRRHVTASAGDFQIDVNTVPFSLLDRTDVVTGGSSAVYGSDAIAGVVNFITQRDYDGIEIDGQAGISSRGDNGRYSLGLTAGKNFADGRGNIAFNAEYNKLNRVQNIQRPGQTGAFDGLTGFFQVNNSNAAGDPPQLVLRDNLRLNFLSDGGTVFVFCRGDNTIQPLACDADGNNVFYRFDQNGNLNPQVAPDEQSVFESNVVGGDGSTLRNTAELFPDIERYNANLLFRFDVSEALQPYAEFKYARVNADLRSTPSFANGFCGGLAGASGLNPACFATSGTSSHTFVGFDNAFLTPQAAALARDLQNELLGAFGVGPLSQGFVIQRNNVDFGPRSEKLKRETYRGVVGFGGTFNDDWKYDISATYGKFKANRQSSNNLLIQNFRNAVDSVLVGGVPTCRINADTSTTNNDPSCVPINIFGVGAPSQAALNYVNTTATFDEEAEQFDVLAYVSGDTSQFFELPGGPVRFVLGSEYRSETSLSFADPVSESGATFLNAFPRFEPPTYKVAEGFAELELPILADLPFAEELTLSGAARYSDYNSGAGATGGVWSYNGNLIYAPSSDIKFRANYSRAVRSPTPSDLFSPSTQNFLFLSDPCDNRNINNGSATRATNCQAEGVPATYQQAAGNRSVSQAGNPFLEAETSNSLTIGAILTPGFLPGFSATIDYYDITVNKVIANISANQILANCYDAPTLNNAFCPLINPRQADGSFNADAALNIAPVNFAKLKAEGIDVDLAYNKTFENGDRFSLRGIGSYVIDRTNFLDVDNPDLPDRVKSELGDQNLSFLFNASYRKGDVSLSYSMRWINQTYIGEYEDYNSFNGNPPLNPNLTAEVFYPRIAYHDLRLDYRVGTKYRFFIGVDNITDKLPPFGLTGTGGGSGTFDNIGRYFFSGFTAEF